MDKLIPVEQKLVNFNNTKIMAVKTNDGKINVGIRWVCDGLGLSEGQRKNQIFKIQEDVVLSRGGRKIILPTLGGTQEVLCLELDFLPLWLAKVNVNIIDNPKVQEKLVDYQLHAKDVLAEAFIEHRNSLTQAEMFLQAAQLLAQQEREISEIKETNVQQQTILANHEFALSELGQRVTNEITLTTREQAQIQGAVSARVAAIGNNRNLYQKLYSALKRHFGIPSYRDLKRSDLTKAFEFIKLWRPGSSV